MAKVGRPSKYSKKLANEMFALLAQGKSIVYICKKDKFPCLSTFFNWLDEIPEFLDRYEKAQQLKAQFLAEELIDICDDTGSDVQFSEDSDENGQGAKPFICKENTAQRRLKIDTRKWVAAKLMPKKYGEKLQQDLNHSGIISIADQIINAHNNKSE